MSDIATRVDSTGFYAGQNRWVAISVKIVVISLVLWASLAPDAGNILMDIQSRTISFIALPCLDIPTAREVFAFKL